MLKLYAKNHWVTIGSLSHSTVQIYMYISLLYARCVWVCPSLGLYYCLPMGLKMYNNKLHIELAVRLIDRLIYIYVCFRYI